MQNTYSANKVLYLKIKMYTFLRYVWYTFEEMIYFPKLRYEILLRICVFSRILFFLRKWNILQSWDLKYFWWYRYFQGNIFVQEMKYFPKLRLATGLDAGRQLHLTSPIWCKMGNHKNLNNISTKYLLLFLQNFDEIFQQRCD